MLRTTYEYSDARAMIEAAYEAVPSLDTHGELIREVLAEVTLLTEKYRHVRRHAVPHVAELAGLLDILWQEIEMVQATPTDLLARAD